MLDMASTLPRAAQKTVLVVVQEPSIRDLIAVNLRCAGFYPVGTATASAGKQLIGEILPDAIVIDMDAEPAEAAALATDLRGVAGTRKVSIVMLSANAAASCGAMRSICGADECVAKPFHPEDLLQRMARMFPSPRASGPGVLRIGRLALDPMGHTVTVDGPEGARELHLPSGEFRLLRYLMDHPDRVLRREQLIAGVWGAKAGIGVRTVDQLVKRLRRVLDGVGLGGTIHTVRGIGYRIAMHA